ncbi:MAG TPA: FecR domain-containing protein [Thermoanaerobaculia bacterium]|nr:FecR domain-containing protein [Thermoanaerobaculia bacterium]
MKSETGRPYREQLFDEAVAAVRDEPVDPQAAAVALARVERRLAADLAPALEGESDHRIRGCEGFRSLIPAYLAGALAEPKRILFEDHTRECVPCRRALAEARRGRPAGEAVASPFTGRLRPTRLALAAGLAGLALAAAALLSGRLGLVGPDASAQVRAIAGELVELDGGALRTVSAGQKIERGDRLRTASDSNAVLELADGTRVELAERSELTLSRRADGVVLELGRGALIVEAAAQKRGHLYVRTDDCLVSVVGTIFSVNHGVRGSRVSVLAGEVNVRQGAELAVLRPGDQLATHAHLARVSLEQEIAWSRNAPAYRERIAALSALGRELDQALVTPAERTSTRLLDLAPRTTGVWIALPNVSGQLTEAWSLVERRVAESPALAEWWQERFAGGESARHLAEAVAELGEFGAHLGGELAIAVAFDGARHGEAPLLLAEIADGRGFDELLDGEIARVNDHAQKTVLVRIADPASASPVEGAILVWRAADDLLAASPSAARLAELGAALDTGGGFAGTPLHARLAEVYSRGAGWLVGVDAGAVLAHVADSGDSAHGLSALGLADAEQFVFESATVGDTTESRATLGFRGARRGVVSWLAEPAPSGALDFVSPEAALAVAGLTKEPGAMFDDVLEILGTENGTRALDELARAESKLGFSLRDDLFGALGGDYAFALDGPWLPKPAWKLVVEVRDPARVEFALGRLVEAANEEAVAHGQPGVLFEQQEVDGRRYLHLATAAGADLAYVSFVDGYLVAAPSRALIVEAIARREAGSSLTRSQAFLDRLPRDAEPNFSALAWQNLSSIAGPLTDLLGGAAPAEQREELVALARQGGPLLVVAYGESDRIRFVALGANGPLGLSFERLLALAGAFGPREADSESPEAAAESVETLVRTAA